MGRRWSLSWLCPLSSGDVIHLAAAQKSKKPPTFGTPVCLGRLFLVFHKELCRNICNQWLKQRRTNILSVLIHSFIWQWFPSAYWVSATVLGPEDPQGKANKHGPYLLEFTVQWKRQKFVSHHTHKNRMTPANLFQGQNFSVRKVNKGKIWLSAGRLTWGSKDWAESWRNSRYQLAPKKKRVRKYIQAKK